jgi:Protein of unknown function (DUF3460).
MSICFRDWQAQIVRGDRGRIQNSDVKEVFMMYESDFTRFMRELMDKHPELTELQKRNRATWWDKKLDLDQQKRFDESSAPVNGYVYFPVPEAQKFDGAPPSS